MDAFAEYIQTLTSSEWAYAVIFLLAVAEASVITSYFLSGTIAFVVVGALVSRHFLDPVWAILAVYAGTVIGDVSSFLFSRSLQRVSFVAAGIRRLGWLRRSLAAAPARFILVGHFTPYLRAMMPVLAAGVVPIRTYLTIELFGAMMGTLFLLGIGFFGAEVLATLDVGRGLAVVGAAATCVLALLWLATRASMSPPNACSSIDTQQVLRTVRAYLLYPFWHPCRWIERWLRGQPSRELRRSIQACFPDVRAGDIFVIRLHVSAPWGKWAHSAIAIDAKNFCHGFAKTVTAHTLAALPVRYAIAHLRVRCDEETAQSAANIARSCVGTPVSIFAHRGETQRMSCASLIVHAYQRCGIELVEPRLARIAPDDLFASPEIELVRIVNTEKVKRETRRYVFESRKEG